jgi:hemin uptake protein HemP
MKDALLHEPGDCLAMSSKGPDGVRPDAASVPRGQGPVRIELTDLLRGGREAIIVHNGADYRLRVTANGKLILTK